MSPSQHAFDVPFRFPVYFTRHAWDVDNRSVVEAFTRLEPGRCHRVLMVIDDQVLRAQPWLTAQIEDYFAAHAASLQLIREPIVVPGGEAAKNDFVQTFTLLQRINDERIDRQSFLAVIGGGAVLDMVSFAAAIAHRGIRVVRFPTTVLAQGDSGIAVKNSVNLFGKKNFIGTFVPPFAVINDVLALETLPLRDKVAGVSEAVKVALLKSPDFYRFLEAHADRLAAGDVETLAPVVRRSAELHLAHICGNGDPFELGSARPLDFGHWAAHKLESITSYRLRHGEAVAIGMALDVMYSVGKGYLDRITMVRILNLLEALGFRLWDDALLEREVDGTYTLIKGLQEFREHLGGELHITLLRGIGASFEVTEMDESAVISAIDALATRVTRHAAAPLTRAASAAR
jgi:3-dehydroquinate synthase